MWSNMQGILGILQFFTVNYTGFVIFFTSKNSILL